MPFKYDCHYVKTTYSDRYQDRIIVMESQVYDLEKEVEFKDFQINQLDFAVNDLKGKLWVYEDLTSLNFPTTQ